MKLTLKNFRCYKEATFDFGTDGLVLLSGQSGVGKTTLLMAIQFVLYGTGTKLTMFGSTSCSVNLLFKNYDITRSKRPNRLVLSLSKKEIYEDDSAQGLIDNLFGTCFDVTSYLQQNALNSFILMSPLDKLSFLEKFALSGIDLSNIKSKTQGLIKKRNEQLIAISSKLETLKEHFSSMTEPEKCSFPIRCNKSSIPKYIKNYEIKIKNNGILLKKNNKLLSELNEKINFARIEEVKRKNRRDLKSSLEKKISKIEKELSNIKYKGDNYLEQKKEELSKVVSRREYLNAKEAYLKAKKTLEDLKGQEDNENKKELKTLKESLWKDYSQEELEENLKNVQQAFKDSQELSSLEEKLESLTSVNEKDIKELEKQLEILRNKLSQKEVYQCPSCETFLQISEDKKLVLSIQEKETLSKEELRKKILREEKNLISLSTKLRQKETILENIKEIKETYVELPSKTELEETIEEYKNYKRKQIEVENRIKKLEKQDSSSIIKNLEEKLKRQDVELKKLKEKFNEDLTDFLEEDEIRSIIFSETEKKNNISSFQTQKSNLEKELLSLEKEINNESNNNLSLLEKENLETEKNIKNLLEEQQSLKEIMEKIELYKKYETDYKEFSEWKTKILDLEKEEKEIREKYSASLLLKEKIVEAESIAIMNIINSINIHSQDYLDLFFPNEPIVVRLLPFKVTKKKTKPQINIEIDYKGNQCELSSLSGGELSRVVLAYTLALAELFNSPLLLLDECTASLDQDLTSAVMEGIKNRFANRLVLVIAHQCVTGDFDRHIQI